MSTPRWILLLMLLPLCALVALIVLFSDWVLFLIAITYMFWGIFSRVFYGFRRGSQIPPSSPDRVVHAD